MKPKVIFTDNQTYYKLLESGDDYYVLTKNTWSDHGYSTKFEVKLIKNKQAYSQSNRKILFENQSKDEESFRILRNKINKDGYVEIKDFKSSMNYISLGNDYEEIKKVFPEYYTDILIILNDISCYLNNGELSSEISSFKNHPAFNDSLLREQSFKKAYNDLILESQNKDKVGNDIKYNTPEFNFDLKLGHRYYSYKFLFHDNDNLPDRINLIIGKNGTGKSQTLKYLAKYLMFQEEETKVTVTKHPDFILNLIIFAYNPYEDFYIPKRNEGKEEGILIKYKYVGLKKRNNENEIIYNPEIPKIESYISLLNLLKKDLINFKAEREKLYDTPYITQIVEHLKKADENFFGFALKLKEDVDIEKYINKLQIFSKPEGNFIFIKPFLETLNDYTIFQNEFTFHDFNQEIYFYDKEEEILPLSSGQKIFSYLVINLLSLIKKNSLVLIDEPETALHPNLEISFMKILKSILDENESYAIVATHSSILTREVPDKFVHVISINNKIDVSIDKPIMKTFGSNIGDITNYIFDDVFQLEKPYQEWLEKQKENFDNYEEFYKKFRKILSYEIHTEAKKMWLSND